MKLLLLALLLLSLFCTAVKAESCSSLLDSIIEGGNLDSRLSALQRALNSSTDPKRSFLRTFKGQTGGQQLSTQFLTTNWLGNSIIKNFSIPNIIDLLVTNASKLNSMVDLTDLLEVIVVYDKFLSRSPTAGDEFAAKIPMISKVIDEEIRRRGVSPFIAERVKSRTVALLKYAQNSSNTPFNRALMDRLHDEGRIDQTVKRLLLSTTDEIDDMVDSLHRVRDVVSFLKLRAAFNPLAEDEASTIFSYILMKSDKDREMELRGDYLNSAVEKMLEFYSPKASIITTENVPVRFFNAFALRLRFNVDGLQMATESFEDLIQNYLDDKIFLTHQRELKKSQDYLRQLVADKKMDKERLKNDFFVNKLNESIDEIIPLYLLNNEEGRLAFVMALTHVLQRNIGNLSIHSEPVKTVLLPLLMRPGFTLPKSRSMRSELEHEILNFTDAFGSNRGEIFRSLEALLESARTN